MRAELGLDPVPGGDYPVSLIPAKQALVRFNANHYGPGPQGGQFAPAGERANGGGAASKPSAPIQVAGGDADDESSARQGMAEQFLDPEAPVRLALFQNAQAKLSALEPGNSQARPILVGPNWTPEPEDLNAVQRALDRAIEDRAAYVVAHAYDKHVTDQSEFPGVTSRLQLQLLVQDVMKTSPAEVATDGSVFFYQQSTNTLVIVNPVDPKQSTVFRPTDGRDYVNRNLRQRKN